MTKITKKENFSTIVTVLKGIGRDDLAAVMEHEIELLEKKAENRASKPTVRQAQNAEIKSTIVASLEKGKWYRCSEIQALVPSLAEGVGTQRTARLCNDLVAEGLLVKQIDKKVVYFALAE